MHKTIGKILQVLANPEGASHYTVLEWMIASYQKGVSFDEFCQAVKLLRDAGIIRSNGIGGNVNSYTFDRDTWSKIAVSVDDSLFEEGN